MKHAFYVGTYANEGQESILRCTADFEAGAFTREAAHTGTVNPSWVLLNREKNVLYSVSETTPNGGLCAFDLSGGGIRRICALPSQGANPCHLELSGGGRFLLVSNYTSGALAAYALDEAGIPLRAVSVREHRGLSGPGRHPVRQEGPHVHFSRCLGDSLLVCDLGLDAVFRYRLGPGGALEEEGPPLRLPAGSGPRHLCFRAENPDLLYVLCELSCQIAVVARDGTGLPCRQLLSTLPEDFDGGNICAAVKLSQDGRYLFASNRGHDSVAVFAVEKDGMLRRTDLCKTGGRTPRDFGVFGSYLVAANQDTRSLTVLAFDPAAGALRQTGMTMALNAKPVCIHPV